MATKQLMVNIGANTSKLRAGLKSAGSSLKSFGASMRSVTLPLTIFGTASTMMAKTFDQNMTKIKTLVGDSESNLKLYEQNIKGIALRTGQSMNAVSDALFAVTSAGIKGNDALLLLQQGSKASAVGMGSVKDITRATTGIMNAYAKSGMTAGKAMDIFKKVVEQGNLEASELAPTLGKVVGTASAMGVSFEEVGASIATFTRLGVDSASAVTGLRSVLSGLTTPTAEAEELLGKFDLTADGLRKKLGTDGLAGTLEMLMEATGGEVDELSALFPNIRALTAVLATAGSQGDVYKGVLEEMHNNHGALDEAFKETTKSASFKLNQAMNGLNTSMTEIGAVILPMVASAIANLSNFFQNAVSAFQSLDSETQLLIGSLAGVTLALPMILSLFGTLLSVIGAILSPIGLIVAGLSAVAYVVYNEWDGIKQILVDIANYFIDLYNESTAFAMIVHGIGAFFKTLYDIAVAVVEGMVSAFKTGVGILKDLFGGLGNIIKGALTLDPDLIGKGFEEVGQAITDNIQLSIDTYDEIFAKAGDSAMNNFLKATDDALGREKIELITTDDIDEFTNKGADMANGLLDQIKGVFSGKAIEIPAPEFKAPPSTGDNGTDEDPADAEGDGVITALEQKENGFRNFLEQSGEALNQNMLSNAENFANNLANSTNPLKAFAGTLMQTAMKQIAVSKAVSTANAVESGSNTASKMPFGAFIMPALIAGLMAVVSKSMAKVPAFAKGGIVGGATLGLMGEYAGARSNPEVIAPLDRLNSMINTGGSQQVEVGGQFEISGENLVLALERTNKTRSRYTQ